MNRNSKLFSLLLKYKKDLLTIVIIFTIFKVVATIGQFFLPQKSIEFIEEKKQESFYLFNLPRSIAISKEQIVVPQKTVQEKEEKKYSLKELTLKAIYAQESGDGFVLVLDKAGESHLISNKEDYKGYVLTKIMAKKAIFLKNKKEYILELEEESALGYSSGNNVSTGEKSSKKSANRVNPVQLKDRVARSEIEKYKKNLNLIWKDIKIQPHYRNRKIEGFDVTYVKRGSVFEQLGLAAGDRLIRGNGMELKSVKDAFTLYKQIDKIKVFKLTILRNGNEEELEYEVY